MTPDREPAPEECTSITPAVQRAFRRRRWVTLLLVTLVVTGVDQLTKHWAQTDLQNRPGRRITLVEGYLALSYVRNPGSAWGFLAQAKESFRQPFFISISLVAMLFILYIHRRLEPGQHLLLLALSLVMGGAVGNFVDRLRYTYVVDFIKMHLRHRFEWPTYNVADVAITCGVALLLVEMLFGPRLQRRRLRGLADRAIGAAAAPERSDPGKGPAGDGP